MTSWAGLNLSFLMAKFKPQKVLILIDGLQTLCVLIKTSPKFMVTRSANKVVLLAQLPC
jgi:hypothetical protein